MSDDSVAAGPSRVGRFEGPGGLRRHAARGTLINGGFVVGIAVLTLLQKLIVAALLTPAQFGVWGAVLITVLLIAFIKDAGVAERFVQQDAPDQELAFRQAFSVDLLLATACFAAVCVGLPLFALAFGKSEILVPGLVLALALFAYALQAPLWIYYRRMDFWRQRGVQSIDPVVNFAVTIVLAILGFSYWSLVVGALAGSFAGAAVAIAMSPYRLGWALDRETIKDYYRFSWPLVAANGSGMAIGQIAQIVAVRVAGFRGGGAVGLGSSVTAFSDGVDGIVTQTAYPMICSVSHDRGLLYEAFVKTNRLALMWGVPFGVAVALFASDLVRFVIGTDWTYAVGVIAAFGLVAAIDQLGYNWHAFLRATNHTGPLAKVGGISLLVFVLVTVPAFVAFGLTGFAVGWVGWSVLVVIARSHYLRHLFPEFSLVPYALRSFAPVLPAVAAVLAARQLLPARSATSAAVELAVFVVAAAGCYVATERRLLREMLAYLRRPRVPVG